ncbi:pre-mRNA-splicing factor PRP17, putative [Pediculus humanus corporis]|uniref:DDB1- and CUL4-associated factor 13 n=1 Tax=Pediculus humanus subsp. corporis TaxID=121224 RepID=E0VTG5_PEDHC|nr:pre-mRNA-splicing factor PRP17, putative [Pediculus humanus corporis]EEB16671.1 pre-mRNA-splicing factor PRP17, putative [Pediculus humanus corporis]
MKVKMLTRNPDVYLRETIKDIHKVPRNFDPSLHPFEVQREYVKALNAVKLEKVFAKPFVGNLDGHKEGVTCISKHPKKLSYILSGAYDGEVKLWDLSSKKCLQTIQAHDSCIRGCTFLPDGEHFITIGDKNIKIWETEISNENFIEPTDTMVSKSVLNAISHHQTEPLYATCGEICQIWEETRSEPIQTFKWGVDSLHDVSYNPIESYLLATCASDRSVILYDSRATGPVRKIKMKLRINKICWNPMEAFVFTGASEDYKQYSTPIHVHKDHVSAVMFVDYSPTGKEFVSGGYDKSIRIFNVNKSSSREIYHTKRMQRLSTVQWTLDDKYIISGSDEMNIRIWKARASEKLGILRPREKLALNYNEALKAKYAAHPQISRIKRHRHVPKYIYNARRQLKMANEKILRKEDNRRKHSKPGTVPSVSERERHFIGVEE